MKASQYVELANDLEINKAITYLRQKDFNQVSATAACMFAGPSKQCMQGSCSLECYWRTLPLSSTPTHNFDKTLHVGSVY